MSEKRNKVVITGMGAITPLGCNVQQLWDSIKAGKNGIAPITAYDPNEQGHEQSAKLAAEVKISASELAEMVAPQKANRLDRFTQLAVVAAREAMLDAGIDDSNTDKARVDVLVSSGIGGMSSTVREYERGQERGFDKISPFYIPMTIANIAAGTIAIEHNLKGDASCVVTACASSAHALGEAMRHVRHGYADVVLCGGSEAVVIPLAMGGFTSMRALHTGTDPNCASVPFDARRSGFVLGEGAGMLVLESEEHAKRRGARIYAELAGFAATCDAYHMTAPDPDGQGAIRAMKNALADAKLTSADINYINAHGTSTSLNDKSEAMAINSLFAAPNNKAESLEDAHPNAELSATERTEADLLSDAAHPKAELSATEHTEAASCIVSGNLPPVSSTKSMTGHLLGAAGAVEAIITTMAIHDGFLPPTINYCEPDPECALDVVPNKGRVATINAALSNSLGFGGHNACLVFKRKDDR